MRRKATHRISASFRKDDDGVSPVIGTILMVAVTVLLGATVYTAVNGFGGESLEAPSNAVLKAVTLDTDRNGDRDAIKVTYISGLDAADVTLLVKDPTGVTHGDPATPGDPSGSYADWSPGDFTTFTARNDGTSNVVGAYALTGTIAGSVVLDAVLTLDE